MTHHGYVYLVAAANATALAAVASSIFFLFLSSASCFSARARASCSAFSLFSSWEMVCLSFCLAWMALWSLMCREEHGVGDETQSIWVIWLGCIIFSECIKPTHSH